MSLYGGRFLVRFLRWVKTLYFLFSMLASLLFVCAPPLFVILLDVLLPSALLLATSNPSSSDAGRSAQLKAYKFQSSLVDVPLVSIARSILILCVYLVWKGQGRYLWITSLCSFGSIAFVSLKAALMMSGAKMARGRPLLAVGSKNSAAVEALFLSSLSLAMAHVAMAYRTSCKERRKMLVYRIDIEAVKLKDINLKKLPNISHQIGRH